MTDINSTTRWFDHSVDIPLLMSHPKTALLEVLQLLDGWQTVIADDISVEQFSGAMTNMVYRCGLLQGGKELQVVLMRVHASSSELFDRQVEIDTFKGGSAVGLGPHLLLLFNNGRVEEFLSQHVTLAASDVRDPAVSAAIANTLATFHLQMSKVLQPPQDQTVQLWQRLKHWQQLVEHVMSPSELQELGMVDLEKEIHSLEQQLTCQHVCWVALCHNDLQYGNIMARLAAPVSPADSGGADTLLPASQAPHPCNSSGDLTKQLQGLHVSAATSNAAAASHSAAPCLAAAVSPRQHMLEEDQPPTPAAATPGGTAAAAAAAQVGAAGCGVPQAAPLASVPSEDGSLSNVSVAGSTTPSLSGLSVHSSSSSAAATRLHAGKQSSSCQSVPASRSGSAFASSVQVMGQGPRSTVQLPDGSLVLPGMRSRPRGQSPDPSRGKRPDLSGGSLTSSICGSSSLGSGLWGVTSEVSLCDQSVTGGGAAVEEAQSPAGGSGPTWKAARVGGSSSSRLGPGRTVQPCAAAVPRHAPSTDGDLLLQFGLQDAQHMTAGQGKMTFSEPSAAQLWEHVAPYADRVAATSSGAGQPGDGDGAHDQDDCCAERAAAAAAAGGGGCCSGKCTGEHDLVLMGPQPVSSSRQQQGGSESPGDMGLPLPLVPATDAGRHCTARSYREARKARLVMSPGKEFPSLIDSDRECCSGEDLDESSGLADDSSGDDEAEGTQTRYSRGRSPARRPSRQSDLLTLPSTGAAAAAAPVEEPCIKSSDAAAAGEAVPAEGAAGPIAAAVTQALADANADLSSCITFIDYEYSGFNPIAFDIANHWCEWAADYHSPWPHVLDFSKLPDKRQRELFVHAYLRALLHQIGVQTPQHEQAPAAAEPRAGSRLPGDADASEGYGTGVSCATSVTCAANVTDTAGGGVTCPSAQKPHTSQVWDVWCWLEHSGGVQGGSTSPNNSNSCELSAGAWQQLVQQLLSATEAYMAASHLQWSLWGIIQAAMSDVEFDFVGYGQQRWHLYLKTRPPSRNGTSS